MKVILKQDIKGIGKKDEIHEVVEKTGYRPDTAAQTLRTGDVYKRQSRIWTVICPARMC